MPITHYPDFMGPPVTLREEQVDTLLAHGIHTLQVALPMLPSINRQYAISRMAHRPLHTNPDFAKRKQRTLDALIAAVKHATWKVSSDDWYLLFLDLYYQRLEKEDLDGPTKATLDVLQQQKPNKAERKALLGLIEAITAWKEERPPAICDDSRVLHAGLTKHPYHPDIPVEDQPFLVTIYRLTSAYLSLPSLPASSSHHHHTPIPSPHQAFLHVLLNA